MIQWYQLGDEWNEMDRIMAMLEVIGAILGIIVFLIGVIICLFKGE